MPSNDLRDRLGRLVQQWRLDAQSHEANKAKHGEKDIINLHAAIDILIGRIRDSAATVEAILAAERENERREASRATNAIDPADRIVAG